jgi:phosphocarrier protein
LEVAELVSKIIKVDNKTGLHARPANVFVKEAIRHHTCSISIKKASKLYNGKSIVSVLSACITCGSVIELIADGEGEQRALEDMVAAVESGLGE